MKIYALSVVKNEADVIEANLKAASKWADKIFVLDNGSTDGTWEKIQALADDIITPWKQDPQPFRDSMRSQLFNEFRHIAQPGDWWCMRLDADEFYYDDPRTFLKQVPGAYHYVCAGFVQFQLTREDLNSHHFTGRFEEDRPYICHFVKQLWVESRFVKHRERLQWPQDSTFPKYMGIVFPKLLIAKHYQYRSPAQVQLRLDVRQEAKATGHHSPHVTENHWEQILRDPATLYSLTDNVDFYKMTPENIYLHQPLKFWIKRILHGLRILP
ncbi:MAG: glycosyltransferase [Sphingobacteriales bacterium]|nr:MAG: glycosyltransferase [Sphingobacteriales bacterium]